MSANLPLPICPAPGELPARIGSYAVRSVIGTGSMGVVYLAHDLAIDRLVAIKTIQRHLLEAGGHQHSAAARFRLEAQAAGRLNHRNIVSVYQFGQDESCAYIVMEYVPGASLGEYLRRPGRLARTEVLCLMFQLLDGLHYAHESGVVHRDIKPANLMVHEEGRLKITDFGIARLESSQVTRVNTIVGSPGYMAPEQYTGGTLDRRVDIFSAGVLLYQMLTGSMPFAGNDEAIMYQIVYGSHQSLVSRSGDPTLAAFDAILDGALAKNPGQRFATALEFRDSLRAVAAEPVAECIAPDRLLPTVRDDAAISGQTTLVPAPVSSPSKPPSVPTGWNESELAGLERELTVHVGPVAKVLVRRAARGVTELAVVRQMVASAIPDLDARARFVAPIGNGGGSRSGSGSASGSRSGSATRSTGGFANTRPSAADPAQLRPEDVEKASAALLRLVGPIAKVMVKRCAEGALTREQFVARVLEQITARVDPKRLADELWRSFG